MSSLHEIARSSAEAMRALDGLHPENLSGNELLDALAVATRDDFVAWEHAPGARPHLVEHAFRAVGNLAALEAPSPDGFAALAQTSRTDLSETVGRLDVHGVLPVVRLALVLLDFAKGGTRAMREAWATDLTVHNEAAAEILGRRDLHAETGLSEHLAGLLIWLVKNHGLAGQHARGETPVAAFRRGVSWLRDNHARLGEMLGLPNDDAARLAVDAMHIVNVADTEAVRPGLIDERLLGDLADVRDLWVAGVFDPEALQETTTLEDRFGRLRRQARDRGEPATRLQAALAALGDRRAWVEEQMRSAQLWYFEPATHAMSSEAALRMLVLGLGLADRDPAVDCSRPFHLSLRPLVEALGAPGPRASYRVRLVEALLFGMDLEALVRGEISTDVLVGFTPRIGGTTAVALELRVSEEAEALVTLLSLYEKRSSVAFHQILKLLCDAYGLRKDDFDRLANESQYLATMNAARSDKERMLDFVRPGTIVEIGPGGGVILDLLEARFPDSDIVGIDVSEAVVAELERRREREQRAWRIIAGDAFELSHHVDGADTVIFCSLLHEIFSYVEHEGRKFSMTPVRALLRAAWAALRPGGRIVIRDGVKPPPGRRIIEFLDPEGPDVLRRFRDDFEGRAIVVDWLDDRRAALSTADAMEFLYCYTWGPASYPYEVRELYGIMERDEYERAVLEWLPGAVAVDIPTELKSYLQPGYVTGLAPKIVLTDESGTPVELPDSNAIWVFERA